MKISIQQLKSSLKKILTFDGISDADSEIIIDSMISADVNGYSTHGHMRIVQLIDGLRMGSIKAQYKLQILRKNKSVQIIEGDAGPGQPIAMHAMQQAISMAKETGVGVVGVVNAGHIGSVGYYSEIAARENCFGITMTTSSPAVVVAGGTKKIFGTNPISYAFPLRDASLVADFSTSSVSRGRLMEYAEQKKKIPLNWAIDPNGNPTNDPEEGLKGGLVTIDGSIKGSLLSLMVSILAGPLIGGVTNDMVRGTRFMDEKPNKGDLFIAFDISSFTSADDFISSVSTFMQEIEGQKTQFRTPGKKYGIELPQDYEIELNKKVEKLLDEI